MPVVRRIAKAIYDADRIEDRAAWEATVHALYDEAAYREERYAALALVGHRFYSAYATDVRTLELCEHLVRVGAWWDVVDEASHRVGGVLLAHSESAAPVIRSWSTSDHLWVRRSSIICQVGHKTETDLDLLATVIEPNIGDPDFFIRKAIGWALREVGYVDPAWVRRFVAAHAGLAPLSRREALRRIGDPPR